MGVCRDSDTCEERLLELKMPLTKLPRRRAVGERRGGWVDVCRGGDVQAGGGGGGDMDMHSCAVKGRTDRIREGI